MLSQYKRSKHGTIKYPKALHKQVAACTRNHAKTIIYQATDHSIIINVDIFFLQEDSKSIAMGVQNTSSLVSFPVSRKLYNKCQNITKVELNKAINYLKQTVHENSIM